MNKNIKDIIHNANYIKSLGYGLENNIIKSAEINIIAHFGNLTCLTLICDNIVPYAHINNIGNLGYLIKGFIELFEVDREDGVFLSNIKNVPCRIVFEKNGETHWGEKAIGIGHFIKDKFILFDEFSKLGLEKDYTE